MKMNHLFIGAIIALLSVVSISAQSATENDQVCRIGMQYQISYNEIGRAHV